MSDPITDFLLLPMPVLWLLLLALLLWRWQRAARAIGLAAVFVFTVFSIPAVGDLLALPLARAAPAYGPQVTVTPKAIVVPTSGAFPDGAGHWWPHAGSILRAVAGRALQQELDLPLILTGASPYPGEPSEAGVTAKALSLSGPDLRIDGTPRNSAETAASVAKLLEADAGTEDGERSVILVTSPSHVARMSAALRHHGIAVYSAPVSDPRADDAEQGLTVTDFIPSSRGLSISRGALWEYMGIGWYWLTGRIALADLFP